MAMALWALGAVAPLIWFLWNSQRYRVARKGAEGKSYRVSPPEVIGLPSRRNDWAILGRQPDPVMESLRRRVWLAFAVWLLYALFGDAFWRVLVGWLS